MSAPSITSGAGRSFTDSQRLKAKQKLVMKQMQEEEEEEGEAEHDESRGDNGGGGGMEFLDPNTYTAHRLHHAAPEHLHLTTRRVFVGPVPKGWLKNHRAEWYKHHLHLNLSRKQDTFAPGPDVGDARRVTNLLERRGGKGVGEGQSRGVGAVPEEEEEDLIDMAVGLEEGESTGKHTSSSSIITGKGKPQGPGQSSRTRPNGVQNTNTATTTTTTTTTRTTTTPSEATASPIAIATTTRPGPVPIIRTSNTNTRYSASASRTPGFDRGESWQTASESFGSHNSARSPLEGPSTWKVGGHGSSSRSSTQQQQHSPHRDYFHEEDEEEEEEMEGQRGGHMFGGGLDGAGLSRPSLMYTDMVTEEPVPLASGSEFGGSSSIAPHSFEASNSLASLLIHDEARRRKFDRENNNNNNSNGNNEGKGEKKKNGTSPYARASRSLLKTPSFLSPKRLRSRAESQQRERERDLGPEVSTNQDKIHGGMVRFNTAVQVHERDRQLKLKLAELSRRRTLRVAVGHHHGRIRHRDGEIIKMENMLVRVECVKAQISDDYDERESIKYDTQVIERWREFVVVCREGSSSLSTLSGPSSSLSKKKAAAAAAAAAAVGTGEELSMCIQLYKSRTVPAIDRQHVSSRSTLTIPLIPKVTHVNLYSSLDKSLVLWHPRKTYTMIYILRPKCSSSSVEWYTFLQRALGWTGPTSLQVYVPDLGVTITLPHPFEKVERRIVESEGEAGAGGGGGGGGGGGVDDGGVVKEEKAIAGEVVRQSLKALRGCGQWGEILDRWEKKERVGLAWRKYDRLEWIHGTNEQRMYGTIGMQRTHVLELRPKIHYPTHTLLPSGVLTSEPPPVEGFLVRLSRGTGRNRQYGNLYFAKRYYFSVHDNLLCFCRPARALPPPPPKLNVHDGVIPPTSQLVDKIPMIYGVAPYELDDEGEEVEWLKRSGNGRWLERRDLEAYNEAERKVNMVLRAEGFVDLCRVAAVVLVRKEGVPEDQVDGQGGVEVFHEKVFMLELENGLNVKFQTHNKQTRDEWVRRLSDLVVYWKARHQEDMTFARKIREENLKDLHIDEEMEALIGQNARKWEVVQANASPMLYHTCGLSSCRAITMSGPLYRKPRKHSTFALYHVLLVHGELIIFTHTQRHRTGSPIPTIHHERHSSLSLQDCFVYSGVATKNDLVYNNPSQGFDANGPVRHALPRLYEGGETSQDEEGMRTFVVWCGRRRGFSAGGGGGGGSGPARAGERRHMEGVSGGGIGADGGGKGGSGEGSGGAAGAGGGGGGGASQVFGNVVGGTGGKAMVFKAQSRTMRDVWVVNIAMEIERLHTKAFEEIKVKP